MNENARFLREYQLKLSFFDLKSGRARYMACKFPIGGNKVACLHNRLCRQCYNLMSDLQWMHPMNTRRSEKYERNAPMAVCRAYILVFDINLFCIFCSYCVTRKLCYRKDDRAMRAI